MKPVRDKKSTRRDFLKTTASLAGMAALGPITGCSTFSIKNAPEFDFTAGLVIAGVNLVDVKRGTIKEQTNIRITGGNISDVFQGDIQLESGQVIDGRGLYAMPGLIDAHCHTTMSPTFSFSALDLFKHLKQQKNNMIATIESGVTTVRDAGAMPATLHGLIEDIRSGDLPGPRIIYCNSILNIKGGHPDVDPSDVNPLAEPISAFIGRLMTNFKTMSELDEYLSENSKNTSFIKLTVDNISVFCGKGKIPVYSRAHWKKITAYAESRQLPISCHCHRKWGFDRAIQYPINSLEHIVSDALLSDHDIETLIKQKISIIPTMTVGQSYLMTEAFDELPRQYQTEFIINEIKNRKDYLNNVPASHIDPDLHRGNLEMMPYYKSIGCGKLYDEKKFLVKPGLYFNMMKYGLQNLKKARDAGINIGVGIDAGIPFLYFGGLYRELEILSRAGFSNEEVLRCATLNNARILMMEDKIGDIRKGLFADIVLFKKNPLKDITACRSPETVLKEGRVLFSKNKIPLR